MLRITALCCIILLGHRLFLVLIILIRVNVDDDDCIDVDSDVNVSVETELIDCDIVGAMSI